VAGKAQREDDGRDLLDRQSRGTLVVDGEEIAGQVIAPGVDLGVDELGEVAPVGGDVGGDLDLVLRRRSPP
jgi:hypothetical protein